MKTLLQSIMSSLVLCFFAIWLSACEVKKSAEEPGDVSEDSARQDDPPKAVKPPEEIISLERAQKMYASYNERFEALTEFRDGEEDARYGWHSLDFYKNYVAYVEQEAAKVGIKVSGLRLYYAAYPEDNESGEQAGYQTYLFLPTYYDAKNGGHIAFDPFQLDDDGKPKRIHELLTQGRVQGVDNKSSVLSTLRTMDEQSIVANMGQMCQPNCSE